MWTDIKHWLSTNTCLPSGPSCLTSQHPTICTTPCSSTPSAGWAQRNRRRSGSPWPSRTAWLAPMHRPSWVMVRWCYLSCHTWVGSWWDDVICLVTPGLGHGEMMLSILSHLGWVMVRWCNLSCHTWVGSWWDDVIYHVTPELGHGEMM